MSAALRVLALPLALALFGPSVAAAATAAAQAEPVVVARAGTPGLTVKIATIAAGRLMILGTAARPGVNVGIHGTTLRAVADAQRAFRFEVSYRTPDCRVRLTTPTGSLAVLISDCGP